MQDRQRQLGRSNSFKKKQSTKGIFSRYIMNPLLREGHKIHVRVYYTVVVNADKSCRATLSNFGLLACAAKPYTTDFGPGFDLAAHNTHMSTSPQDLDFPKHYPGDANTFLAKAAMILTTVTKHTHSQIKPYDESQHGFEIFGCDFIEDTDGKVWLIEINHKPSHARLEEGAQWDWHSNNVLKMVCESVLGIPPEEGEASLLIPVWPEPDPNKKGDADATDRSRGTKKPRVADCTVAPESAAAGVAGDGEAASERAPGNITIN